MILGESIVSIIYCKIEYIWIKYEPNPMKNIPKSNHRKLTLLFICFFFQTAAFTQTQKGADIDGEAASDQSGWSVSMPDANTVAIGAPYNGGTASYAGHVRIYSWSGSAWTQKGADIDGEAADNQSGWSVSMPDANTVAIGAIGNNGTASVAGHVKIYSWSGSAWTQKGADIDGEAAGDHSAGSVSMPDANTVAIGAVYNDGSAINAGHVRIYSWSGSAWTQKGDDIDGEAAVSDQSGFSVSMPDANTVAIGAIRNDGTAADAGHVRIYSWSGAAWTQKGADIDGEAASDNSGHSVSMPDANTVAIGAHRNSGKGIWAGHVRIYSWSGSAWTQKGTDIDGDAASDQSGFSVSMPDANTVTIGARYNYGTASNTGHVRIYSWSGAAWTQKGTDIKGEATDDQSGWSVSMPDANTVAIGAIGNDGTASIAGHVRVYTLCKNSTESIARTACYSYVSPSKKYTYTKSDTYYDTIPNASGCDSVITINLTINSADVSVTNSSPTLTANAAMATYQWLDCDNNFTEINSANSKSYLATSNGNYAVEVTQNGCIDTSLCINVSNANILESTFGNQLKVFPNPTKDEVTVELGNHYNEVSVIVRNALGQEVMSTSFNKTNAFIINIPGETGLYMLELHAPEHKALLRVLKN
jgi:hypothetical protein